MAKIVDHTNEVLAEIDKRIADGLIKAGLIVERRAKQICPRKTSRLARSITSEVSKNRVVIGSNVEYAPMVEMGTRPHTITPKNKKALFWPGAGHPVKVVNHPGTRPQPFLRPALIGSLRKIKKVFGAK